MRTTAKLFSLALFSLFIASGCATTEEKPPTPGEIALQNAIEANNAAKAAGNEWRDTGKLIKYAKKALSRGEDGKAVLLANKAERQAKIAQGQAAYEQEKFLNSLSKKDKATLESAQKAIEKIKKEELRKAMAAQAKAAREAMAAKEAQQQAPVAASSMDQRTLSTSRSSIGTGEDTYTVVKGDSLWGIAGKDSVYSNSYQWPLIYKANRHKIKDADLIYPGQNFDIDRGASQAEIDAAVNHAKTRGAWSIGDVEQSDLEYLNR